MSASQPERFACSQCDRAYARPEHLRRHQRTHSARDRTFQCADCSKTFGRRDVWRRHLATHQASPLSEVFSRDARACLSCASSKLRCDRAQPCHRCAHRNQACIYPDPLPQAAPPIALSQPLIPIYGDAGRSRPLDTGTATQTAEFGTAGWAPDALFDLNWLSADTGTFAPEASLTPASAIPFDFSVMFDDSWASRSPEDGLNLSTPVLDAFPSFLGLSSTLVSTAGVDGCERGPLVAHTKYAKQPDIERQIFSMRYQSRDCKTDQIISDAAFQNITQSYLLLCQGNSMFPAFSDHPPPKRHVLEHCLSLYKTNFHQSFPIAHMSTDLSPSSPWTLLLAICAIGSQYLEGPDSTLFSISMQEFLRRVLIAEEETSSNNSSAEELLEAKIRLLQAIGAGYLGHKLLFRSAIRSMSDLTAFCRSQWTARAFEGLNNPTADNINEQWEIWRHRQQKLRVGYGIWLLDALWSFQHHRTPALSLDDTVGMPLPCSERLWDASNATEWSGLQHTRALSAHDTLLGAIQHLYVDKTPLTELSPFEISLLVLGICHQTWGVQKYVRQGLSRFEPSPDRRPSDAARNDTQRAQIWPPSIPLFNKWRNAACDSLDLLQLSLAGGPERSTTLVQLHQAHMALLAPMYNIVRFASYLAGNSRGTPLASNSADAREDRHLIQSWAKHDHFKARSVATRAGAVFWEVRRLDCVSFNEPPAVALATLVLWAYSIFATSIDAASNHVERQAGPPRMDDDGSSSGGSSSTESGTVVLLDRPVDTELIEQFIRQETKVDALLTGVGDVRNLKAPEKILAQGRLILEAMLAWRGCCHGWIYLFDNLAVVTKKVRRKNMDLRRHDLVKSNVAKAPTS